MARGGLSSSSLSSTTASPAVSDAPAELSHRDLPSRGGDEQFLSAESVKKKNQARLMSMLGCLQ